MKKSVAAAVGCVVLGAAYVGATAWTGQKIAVTYQDTIARVQAQYPMIKITEQSYDKRFFSATHTMTVQLGCASGEPDPEAKLFKLTLVDTIHHGPFAGGTLAAATIDTELVLTPEVQAEMAKLFGSAKPISAHTQVGFNGGYSSTAISPAGKMDVPEGHMTWQGLTFTGSTDSSHRTLDFSLKLPGLELTEGASGTPTGGRVKFAGLSFEGRAKAVTELGWLRVGTSSGTLDSLEIDPKPDNATPVKLLLSGIKFTNSSTADKDLLAQAFTLTGSGTLNDAKIDKIDLRSSVRNLHIPTYERILSTLMKSPQCDIDAQANGMAMLGQIQQDMLALLPYDPGMRLDKLVIEVGGKQAELSAALDVQGITAADVSTLSMPLLIQHGTVAADLKFPVAWIQQIAAQAAATNGGRAPDAAMIDVMLQDVVTKGLVLREGDDIRSSLKFDKGQLNLNGKTLPMGGSKI